jgi:hypothetical protein
MAHAREKLRMKEATNELASLISSLNLRSEEKILDVEYNMIELVDWAWGRKTHLDLSLGRANGEE